jgi:hypothetical protein
MSPAVRSSFGRCSVTSVSTVVSDAFTVTFRAARTAPSPSRTGAATERIPGASSSSASAQPRARTVRSSCWTSASGRSRAYGGRPAWLGCARTAVSAVSSSAASSTLPCEVRTAGNLVPMVTRSVMIFGTATRATYTMSEPSSWDMDDDSLVAATRFSMCGRAMSHSPSALT